MWGGVSVHGLYPSDGPVFRDDLLKSSAFRVHNLIFKTLFFRNGKKKRTKSRRVTDEMLHSSSLLKLTSRMNFRNTFLMGISSSVRIINAVSKRRLALKIRKFFWKSIHAVNIKVQYLLLREGLGEVYNSYNNSEKEREVCRPSRVDGIHDGFDKKKQAVKLADVYGIEKVWRGIHSSCTEHGDFETLRSI